MYTIKQSQLTAHLSMYVIYAFASRRMLTEVLTVRVWCGTRVAVWLSSVA